MVTGHQHNNIMRDLVRLVSSENNISFARMVKKVEYTGLVSIVMATLTTIQPFLLIRILAKFHLGIETVHLLNSLTQ